MLDKDGAKLTPQQRAAGHKCVSICEICNAGRFFNFHFEKYWDKHSEVP